MYKHFLHMESELGPREEAPIQGITRRQRRIFFQSGTHRMDPFLDGTYQRELGNGDQQGESREWAAHPPVSEHKGRLPNHSHHVGPMEEEVRSGVLKHMDIQN